MLDGTGRSSQDLTYTCMVEMMLRSWYITWKGDLKKGEDHKNTKKTLVANYGTLVILLINKILQQNSSGHAEESSLILLVFNSLKSSIVIVSVLG